MNTVADTYGIKIINGKGATDRFLEDLERLEIEQKRNEKIKTEASKKRAKSIKKQKQKNRKANRR